MDVSTSLMFFIGGTAGFTMEQITLKTASNKMAKYEKMYFDNQYVFI